MEKRYQVFVSSTFVDLVAERQEITQALLELDCIPAGMELFPAANEDQWTLIKKVIDDCDYYLVVIAGKYGSIGPEGISYTEMEYRYALEQGKPIIAFLHKDISKLTADKVEIDFDRKKKLLEFCDLAKRKMVKFWETPAELGSVVSRSLVQLIKSSPAIGWVRGNNVTDESSAQEILRLRKKIEQLEKESGQLQRKSASGAKQLAQGDEAVKLRVVVTYKPKNAPSFSTEQGGWPFFITWNNIVAAIAPSMISEASESTIKSRLEDAVSDQEYEKILDHKLLKDAEIRSIKIDTGSFETCIVQLVALDIITKSNRNRSLKDKQTYWKLSDRGEQLMYMLRAIASSTTAQTESSDTILNLDNVEITTPAAPPPPAPAPAA